MKQEYLKIKIMSLGAEARIDRARERKLLDRARRLKFMTLVNPDAVGPYDHLKTVTTQQQKWKTRAIQAKAKMRVQADHDPLELEAQCVEAYSTFFGVRYHRINTVKRICRHSHLAYGFLRGMPYSWMESTCHTLPDWGWKEDARQHSESVLAIALRFSGKMDSTDVRQKLAAWCEEADAYIKRQRAAEERLAECLGIGETPVQQPAEAV